MTKVTDLNELEEREFPLVAYVDRDEEDKILHIIRKTGTVPNHGWMGGKETKWVTGCNRVLGWAEIYGKEVIHSRAIGYKMCPRCGTPDDFQQALNDYHKAHRRADAEYKAKQEAERIARHKAYEEEQQALANLGDALREAGLATQPRGDELTIEMRGYRFHISARKIEDGQA